MRMGVRLPLDTIVTMSAVMKSGKIKQDSICFKKGIPDTKFKRRHNVRPVSLGRSGGMEHAEGGSRGRGGLRPSICCGRRDREWSRETD